MASEVVDLARAAERFAARVDARRQRNLGRDAKQERHVAPDARPRRDGDSFEDAIFDRLCWLYAWPRDRHVQAGLRDQLTAWGRRRIDRKALRRMAAAELPGVRERLGPRIEAQRERLGELEARLAAGVCTVGPSRGRPYTESGRLGVLRLIRNTRWTLANAERALAFVEAEPDALRAILGCRSRRAVDRALRRR